MKLTARLVAALCVVTLLIGQAYAQTPAKIGQVYNQFPTSVDASARYVIYSHGYIVEGTDPQPVSPKFGMYDFPAIKVALQSPEYHVIAVQRPAKTEPFAYAKQLALEVQSLINAGVAAEHITLIGFSRGAALTMMASSELQNPKLNLVIMAGCAGLVHSNQTIAPAGRILSIYETSDEVGSCQDIVARGKNVAEFNEVAISTGKSHGAFYLPRDEWLAPLRDWIKVQ
ncbi:alpha/beta hydrolase [Pseudoalteromonas fenneropenaei]|uniref:Alpha/beta hydrolase n=1 Tax=Pseudoalteromonas fenneropenaei TaxID=1737459 RepID=A0ABV7CG35_9GAMM